MRKTLVIIGICYMLPVNAQNYFITFNGIGASTTVNTVKVENLTTGTSLTINGSDVLRLTSTVGIHDIENVNSSRIKIYPNPMTENSKMVISPPDAGDAIISVCDITGRIVTRIKRYVENYPREFILSGFKQGLYFIYVKGNTYQFSGKLISNGKANGKASIEIVSDKVEVDEKPAQLDSKGSLATVDMGYTTGDRIKFTGLSGDYSTVWIDIPANSKTVTFDFVDCSDGDNNNYPTVLIGSQLWMAENLKTTKFKNGTTPISNVTGDASWGALTTPGFCWYSNNETTNKPIYGALYNWYAVNSGNLCPTGWHVPSDVEWTVLINYLGGTSLAGGKLKETGIVHWKTPNIGATNETGFTALPGGYRVNYGTFGYIGDYGYWWSATEYDPFQFLATGVTMFYSTNTVGILNNNEKSGFSVRCIKD